MMRENVRLMEERRERELMEGRVEPGYGLWNGGERTGNEDGYFTNGTGYFGYGSNPLGFPGGNGGHGGNGGGYGGAYGGGRR